MAVCQSLLCLAISLLLLAGGVEPDRGPAAPFTVCILNVRPFLNDAHFIAVSDAADLPL